jgi:hypothetical protein
MAQPLPPIPEDPAFIKGDQIHATFTQQAQAIRADFGITDVIKAEKITALWESANTTLSGLWQDLQARRQARVKELQATIPIGPDIPPNTTPADEAVLRQSWRAVLAQAQGADPAALQRMYAEAQRFGDDAMMRAVLTVATDGARPDHFDIVRSWAETNGATAALEELASLINEMNGSTKWSLRLFYALGQIDKPQEAWNLPTLTAARDAAIKAGTVQSRQRY